MLSLMLFKTGSNERKLVLVGGLLVSLLAWYLHRKQSKKRAAAKSVKEKQHISIKMMEALQHQSVHIQDPERVEEIINGMVKSGPNHLQVIADFDRTLSGYMRDGRPVNTCHQALDHSPMLPDGYREKACSIRDTYYPIEIDPHKTVAEKIPYMVEWWRKAHELLVSANFTRSTLQKVVSDSNVALRDGCVKMLEDLALQRVPVLIFSAGVGDIIEEVLRQQAKLHENIKVVSNYMEFNSQGQLVGFQGDVIHVFNKNKGAIAQSDYFQQIKSRGSIILLGDSLGDLSMADGVDDAKHILKIGFLNDNVDHKLDSYKSKYDIVLVNDETVHVPMAILQQIF